MSKRTAKSNFFPIFANSGFICNPPIMHKIVLLCLIFLCFGAVSAVSQANELESVLESQAVTFAQASRFVLEAAEVLAVNDPEEAFLYGQNAKAIRKYISPPRVCNSMLLMALTKAVQPRA